MGFKEYYRNAIREKKGDLAKKIEKGSKWTPPEGFFTKSADAVAKGLKKAHNDLKSAMASLTAYINRAGKNLSKEDKNRLENAKEKLRNLYK